MSKINWKVRAKNPYFWASIISSVVTILYIILDKLQIYPALTENDIVAAISAVCSILSAIGVVADPTTDGLGDSERALQYTDPKDSNKLTEEENETDGQAVG